MMPRFLTLTLIFILALGSCTIEKRTFNRGYHVSWNKKVDFCRGGLGGLSTTKDEIKTTEEVAENEESVAVVESETKPVVAPATETDLNPPRRKSVEFVESLELPESASPDTVYIYPKYEPLGIASFATSVSAYGTFFIGIFFWEMLIYVSFALLILGLIFGLLSLTEYGRNKIFYKKNVFGIIGTCLAAAPILFWLVLFVIEEFF